MNSDHDDLGNNTVTLQVAFEMARDFIDLHARLIESGAKLTLLSGMIMTIDQKNRCLPSDISLWDDWIRIWQKKDENIL